MGIGIGIGISKGICRRKKYSGGVPEGPDLSGLKTGLIEAWDWQNTYAGSYASTPSTQQPGPPAFVDSVNGKGILVQSSGGTHEVRIKEPSENIFNPGLRDMCFAFYVKYRTIVGFGNSQQILRHKGSSGQSAGISIYYRGDLESLSCEFANGSSRITTRQANGSPLDEVNGNYVVINLDRDGNCEIFVDKVSVKTEDISAFELDDIVNDSTSFAWGNGNHTLDNCFVWERLLTQTEIDTLADENVGFSDLP